MSKTKNKKIIPEYESGARRLFSDAHDLPYSPLKTFEEAKKFEDAYMIMEGDWGGQIYVVAPVKLIKCSLDQLKKLLKEIDAIAWSVNDGEGAEIFFERKKIGTGVPGGMGGGAATGSLWVHEDMALLKDKIMDVLSNNVDSLN